MRTLKHTTKVVLLASVLGLTACQSSNTKPTTPPIEPPTEPVVAHVLALSNQSGATLANYPLELGQAFLPKEVAKEPKVLLDGKAVESQAQVTQRWPDGSVRFARLSAILPSVSKTHSIGFAGGEPTLSAPKTVAQLLADVPLNVQLQASSGATSYSYDLNALLNSSKLSIKWLSQGPVRYELYLADHANRSLDFGFDGKAASLRPSFYVTFWPKLNTAKVRMVLENPSLDTLVNQSYNTKITIGGVVKFEQTAVNHFYGSRWTKSFWVGSQPTQNINLDSNVAHLRKTGLIPHYVPTTPSESQLAANYSGWNASDRKLYGRGLWQPYMPTTGGRGDIGMTTQWNELWLSSGDYRAKEVALGQADLAGAWPLHFREVSDKVYFDRKKTIPAKGMPISVNAYPTLWFPNNNGVYEGATEYPNTKDWSPDGAHQPDAFSVPYLLTGDPYYLECLQMWAATSILGQNDGKYGRGASGYAGITDQIRGNGWLIRSRALAATLSDQNSPQELYFTQAVNDALAYWEGQKGIAGTFTNHPNRIWAAQNAPWVWSPLRFWNSPESTFHQESLWMDYYFMMELDFIQQLGFETDAILKEYSKLLSGQFGLNDYPWRYLAAYRHYTSDVATGAYFTTWAKAAEVTALNPESTENPKPNYLADTEKDTSATPNDPSYAIQASAAAAAVHKYSSVPWSTLKPNIVDVYYNKFILQDYRRWNLEPRGYSIPKPLMPQ